MLFKKQIVDLSPDILYYFDEHGNLIINEKVLLEDLIDAKNRDIEATKIQMQLDAKAMLEAGRKSASDAASNVEYLQEQLEDWNPSSPGSY